MLRDLLVRIDQRTLPPVARLLYRLIGGAAGARVFTAVGMVLTVMAMLTAVWAVNMEPPASGSEPSIRVGPADGQLVSEYIGSSRARLSGLLSQRSGRSSNYYALVAFGAYLAPDRLTPIIGGVSVSWTYLRVPMARASTGSIRIPTYEIPADVTVGMEDMAVRKDQQAAAAQRLMASVADDTVEHRQLRAGYRSQALAEASEATALRQHCSCVYAVVVQAPAVALDEIARRSEVRVVDPVPHLLRAEGAIFRPPLPEQLIGASVPDDEALDPTMAAAQAIPSLSASPRMSKPVVQRTSAGQPGRTVHTIPVRPAPSCTRTSGGPAPNR